MSVASDLQTTIARLDVAIAAGESYGRVDLDRLRRELTHIGELANAQEQRGGRDRQCFAELVSGLDIALTGQRRLIRNAVASHSVVGTTVQP